MRNKTKSIVVVTNDGVHHNHPHGVDIVRKDYHVDPSGQLCGVNCIVDRNGKILAEYDVNDIKSYRHVW